MNVHNTPQLVERFQVPHATIVHQVSEALNGKPLTVESICRECATYTLEIFKLWLRQGTHLARCGLADVPLEEAIRRFDEVWQQIEGEAGSKGVSVHEYAIRQVAPDRSKRRNLLEEAAFSELIARRLGQLSALRRLLQLPDLIVHKPAAPKKPAKKATVTRAIELSIRYCHANEFPGPHKLRKLIARQNGGSCSYQTIRNAIEKSPRLKTLYDEWQKRPRRRVPHTTLDEVWYGTRRHSSPVAEAEIVKRCIKRGMTPEQAEKLAPQFSEQEIAELLHGD